MKYSVLICIVFLLTVTTPVFSSDKINITFINPADTNDSFWIMVTSFMEAAAEDLSINLEILYTERDHFNYAYMAKQVVNRKTPPDYLIVVNEKKTATKTIKFAESAKVKSFLLINGFIDEDIAEFGRPREKYKYWIGERVPDNFHGGYFLGKKIIKQALYIDKSLKNKELHIW